MELGAREEDGEGMETGERGAWKRPMSVGARSVYAGGSMEGPMDFVRSGPGSFSLFMPMPEIMVASVYELGGSVPWRERKSASSAE